MIETNGITTTARPRLAQALIFLVVAALFWKLRDYSRISLYQERDLFRAGLFAQGNFFLYGPELSGGGNLPGPFYYGLLGLTQLIQTGWKSAYALLASVHALGIALGFGFFFRRYGKSGGWIFLSTCLFARFMQEQVLQFWNPSFLPFLIIAYLLFCEQIYDRNRWSLRFRFALFLFCGLSLQFHSLGILFFLHATLDAHWLRRRPWKEGLADTLFFILPSLPYLVSLSSSRGSQIGALSGVLAYIELHLKNDFIPRLSISDFDTNNRLSLRIFVLGAIAAIPFLRRDRIFRSFSLFFLFSLVPAVIALREDDGGRYGLIAATAALVLVTAGLLQLRSRFLLWIAVTLFAAETIVKMSRFQPFPLLVKNEPISTGLITLLLLAIAFQLSGWKTRKALGLAAAFAVFFVLTSAALRTHSVRKHRYPMNRSEFIAREIYKSTAWPFEEVERRLFFVNLRSEFGLYYNYLNAIREGRAPTTPARYDGFFAAKLKDEGLPYDETEQIIPAQRLRELLETIHLEKTLHLALQSGELELFDGRSDFGVVVIPYRVKPGSVAPASFHNYGRTYISKPFAQPFPSEQPRPMRTYSLPGGHYAFLFRQCPNTTTDCDVLGQITLHRNAHDPGTTTAELSIDGTPISQPHFALTPDWAETLISPQLLFKCGKGALEHREVAGRIGSLGENEFFVYRGLTSNFLAPFHHEIVLNCPIASIQEIGFGFDSSYAMSFKSGEHWTFPARSLSTPTMDTGGTRASVK